MQTQTMTVKKSEQVRRPRSHWVTVLEKLVAPLNADPTKVYEWSRRDSYFRDEVNHGRFEVVALYVFGSFARGAADSSDLDLIVVVAPQPVYEKRNDAELALEPAVVVVKKALWGQPRHIEIFVDRIEHRYHRDRFSEHRLVWSREQPDLDSNLAAIPLVPDAGRFARKGDQLPFSVKLFDSRGRTGPPGEEIVDAIERGELLSTVIPLDSIDVSREWTRDQRHAVHSRGDKRPWVVPTMHHVFDSIEPPYAEAHGSQRRSPTKLLLNGHFAMFRMPELSAAPLFHVNVLSLLLVPDVPKSVTPAIWKLERGPQHPIFEALKRTELWFLADGAKPALVLKMRESRASFNDHVVLHAFGTQQDAEKAAKKWKKESRLEMNVVAVRGAALLDWLCRAQHVFLNGVKIETGQEVRFFLMAVRSAMAGGVQHSPPLSYAFKVVSMTSLAGICNLEGGGFLAQGRVRNLTTGYIVEVEAVLRDLKSASEARKALRYYLRDIESRDDL